MSRKLTKVILDEISLVDEGADENAVVTLFKRHDSIADQGATGGSEMSDNKNVAAQMAEIAGAVAILSKSSEQSTAAIATLVKRMDDAEAARQEQAAQDRAKSDAEMAKRDALKPRGGETPEELEAALIKSLDPDVADYVANVKKRQERAERELTKLADARQDSEYAAVVKADMDRLPVKAEDFGPILKRAANKIGEDDFSELTRVLKAASAAMSEMASPLGYKGLLAKNNAEQELEVAAKAIANGQNVSMEKANTLALEQNPELYSRYLVERSEVN